MHIIAKSTIHSWLVNYPLHDRTTKQTEAQIRSTKAMQARYKKKRDDAYEMGWQEAPNLLKDPFFRDFVNMYLAEGYKKTIHSVEIANSDATVMIMAQFFMRSYANSENIMEYRVQVHVDQNVTEIRSYWGEKMNILPDSITIQRKSNSGALNKRNFRSEFGVLSIRIGDTYFRARLEGWMDYLRKLWLDKFNE